MIAAASFDWTRFALRSSLQTFLLSVVSVSLRRFSTLFRQAHGWRHRTCGGLTLLWLVIGCAGIPQSASPNLALLYDIVLGCLGVASTLTAARDFPHRHVSNPSGQSGTLSNHALVTQNEMVEHSFYQGINLSQALYLHSASRYETRSMLRSMLRSWLALGVVTAPWWMRQQFPVHSFSDNWKKQKTTSSHEILLYKIKKAQYLFGKHVILHGLNLTVCTSTDALARDLVTSPSWRLFWICLNAAYVLEFFLQSLVKRCIITQSTMLALNRVLMVISSLAALESVFAVVRWDLCVVSLALNFVHRGHDVVNTMFIAAVALGVQARFATHVAE